MITSSPGVRLALFAMLLALTFAVAFGIGSAVSPVDDGTPMEMDHGAHG